MKKIKIALSVLLLAISAVAFAQSRQGNSYVFNAGKEKARITFCSADMFRVRVSKGGKFAPEEHLMQENYTWPAVAVKVTGSKGGTSLSTGKIIVRVSRSPFKVSVYNAAGKLISADRDGFIHNGDTVGCRKQLMPGEHFFGFGERMDFIDQHNKLLKLNVGRGKDRDNLLGAYNINEANYCPVPFFLSTR